jgi:hypothetical protein
MCGTDINIILQKKYKTVTLLDSLKNFEKWFRERERK